MKKMQTFEEAVGLLMVKLNSTRDGWVTPENYETAMHKLRRAEEEWDEVECGGPFPFKDGQWGQFLA